MAMAMAMAISASSPRLQLLACYPLPFWPSLRSPPLFARSSDVRHVSSRSVFRHFRLPSKYRLADSHHPAHALQESESLPQVVDEDDVLKMRLQELGDSLKLPDDYLEKLPNDLRVDLNDAAFALSSGPFDQECHEQVKEVLMQLSRAWEKADTQASMVISRIIPSLYKALPSESSSRVAIGKRFVKSGRFLIATGQYGQGELQKIGSALVAVGETLSAGSAETMKVDDAMILRRTLKFGEMQVELTSTRAFTGSAISFFFGILSWQLASGLQNIPEESLSYANNNALLLATSLRGTLLAAGYSVTALSAFTMLGLLILGVQLNSSKQ